MNNMSQPLTWQPPPPELPPPPPLRTTTSHVFFLSPLVQSKAAHTNITAVTPELAQAGLASSATTGHAHAAQPDTDNHELASNSSTACFLGIPTEIHCMIYEYLWTPTVNIYIISPSLSPPKVNAIHPIFNVNRQIRSEAIYSLRKHKSLTFALHASADDLDFRKMVALLEDLDKTSNRFKESGGSGKKTLQVHLHLNFRNAYLPTLAPGGFADFIACLAKLELEAEYEYTFIDRDGHTRGADFARLMIVNQINRLIDMSSNKSSLDYRRARKAVEEMRFLA